MIFEKKYNEYLSLINDGLDRLLQEKTGINVMIAEDAISCVAKGTGKALDNLDSMDRMRK